jgi:hypothetical protein
VYGIIGLVNLKIKMKTNKTHTQLVFETISTINKKLRKTPENKKNIIKRECLKNNLNEKNIIQIGRYDWR